MASFKTRLKLLRKKKDLNQEEFAEALSDFTGEKITRSRLASYEQGVRFPDLEMLEIIADFFNVDLDYLTGRQEKPNRYKIINKESFEDPAEAMKFILEQPSLMAYGGYDLNKMSDEEILAIANDLLYALKLSAKRHEKNSDKR